MENEWLRSPGEERGGFPRLGRVIKGELELGVRVTVSFN